MDRTAGTYTKLNKLPLLGKAIVIVIAYRLMP
jgi:hypothetical protein